MNPGAAAQPREEQVAALPAGGAAEALLDALEAWDERTAAARIHRLNRWAFATPGCSMSCAAGSPSSSGCTPRSSVPSPPPIPARARCQTGKPATAHCHRFPTTRS